MDLTLLQSIRQIELIKASESFPSKGKILEVGAGAGWQSKMLEQMGWDVNAIDLISSNYNPDQIFPVKVYDGRHIPFPDGYFDAVFSSNVLEHIPHVLEYQKEIWRVLKANGFAIHVLPTPTWRFWTSVAHYPVMVKEIFRRIAAAFHVIQHTQDIRVNADHRDRIERKGLAHYFAMLFPSTHGVRGDALSEIFFFSRIYWKRVFLSSGWNINRIYPAQVFYTGYFVSGQTISMLARKFLSKVLGSSCQIFVLTKSQPAKK